jgi:hypothetical protein
VVRFRMNVAREHDCTAEMLYMWETA